MDDNLPSDKQNSDQLAQLNPFSPQNKKEYFQISPTQILKDQSNAKVSEYSVANLGNELDDEELDEEEFEFRGIVDDIKDKLNETQQKLNVSNRQLVQVKKERDQLATKSYSFINFEVLLLLISFFWMMTSSIYRTLTSFVFRSQPKQLTD